MIVASCTLTPANIGECVDSHNAPEVMTLLLAQQYLGTYVLPESVIVGSDETLLS